MSSAINDKTSNSKLNELEQIKKFTTVVADTAHFESIREFKPQDATTNPSLVYAAAQKANYSHFLKEVLVDRRNSGLRGAERWRTSSITFWCGLVARC
jgi:transaldolase